MPSSIDRRKALGLMAASAATLATTAVAAKEKEKKEEVKIDGGWQFKELEYEKHIPEVTVKRTGDIAEITVFVKHPQTAAHHISTFKIYDNARLEISRSDLNPEISEPKAAFYLKVEKDTELIATTDCNLHGIWMKPFKA